VITNGTTLKSRAYRSGLQPSVVTAATINSSRASDIRPVAGAGNQWAADFARVRDARRDDAGYV